MPCQVFLDCRRYLQAGLRAWLPSLQGKRSGDRRRGNVAGDAEEHQKERTGRAGGSCEHVGKYAVELVQAHYSDFGPTFAAEVLAEKHGIRWAREILRRWMIVV